MSSDHTAVFTKENLNDYLKELAKEYRKINGKAMPAEIILVGGAAILAGYGFRDMTTDIDAVIHASSSMKDAINRVGDRFHLPNGWLNSDFLNTDSYTVKLNEYSVYYRTFSNVLTVRTVGAEYLIAMKLRSGRQYKNDLSDIVGILAEHEKRGEPISMEQINTAAEKLYGSWDSIPDISKRFIEDTVKNGQYSKIYAETVENERQSKDTLVHFADDYPGVMNEGNVNDILKSLKEKKKESVLGKLKEYQTDIDKDSVTHKHEKKRNEPER